MNDDEVTFRVLHANSGYINEITYGWDLISHHYETEWKYKETKKQPTTMTIEVEGIRKVVMAGEPFRTDWFYFTYMNIIRKRKLKAL